MNFYVYVDNCNSDSGLMFNFFNEEVFIMTHFTRTFKPTQRYLKSNTKLVVHSIPLYLYLGR